ncbi:MAG: alanine--tRNA ligase [Myxococcales bacterium]|nr:alanine--tRNA ligase [Myxococcales bacterium]
MKAADVRRTFLEFFASHGHEQVASSALVPSNDPTLLFTNAGMVQFKDVFTGVEHRAYKRATTSQKCLRAGGKHNDLDEVGKTPRHHTFFEMLGNFSFGDYFKEEAIAWAWTLLTDKLGIDTSRMCITVFGGEPSLGLGPDDEARAMWKRVTGFSDERIIGLGMKDNFWMMGDVGPMGPCSELHYFQDGAVPAWPTTDPASWKGWLEIWNLVFMQFERKVAGGPLLALPAPSIDTGAGLERVTSVLQGKPSNYDTDLFLPILHDAAALARVTYGGDLTTDTSLRVIADHARATAFLIADGVFPDKTGREYVLRRIFRRAVRHGKLLGITEPFMHRVCERVIVEMSGQFPELTERKQTIVEVALEEEKRFRATLDRGLDLLETEFGRMRGKGETKVPGKAVFTLYDTFGFPQDLTEIIAEERGFGVDRAGFDAELAAARERSRFTGSDQEAVSGVFKAIANDVPATKFTGYDELTGTGSLKAIVVDGKQVAAAKLGAEVALVFDQTPFYAESGGQAGDQGELTTAAGARVRIEDTKKPTGDMFVLFGEVIAGELAVGDAVQFAVDADKRAQTRANHSATHLLNHALRTVLGSHVAQKGSLVSADRLRFDFAHFSPMTDDQLREVEALVNRQIRGNVDSVVEVLKIDDAKKKGAVAMFGEKYGDVVRVVHIGSESLEFCGGTHVARAGDIGLLKIISEAGIAQGVRRIEAVTGVGALDYVRRLEVELDAAGEKLKAGKFEVAAKVARLMDSMKATDKELEKLKAKLAGGGGRDLLQDAVVIGGIKTLIATIDTDDAKVLRETGLALRDKIGSGAVFLAAPGDGKVSLFTVVTADLVAKVHAGQWLSAAATALGGKGGGKADMAQGGGADVAKLPQALDAARAWITAL